MSLSFDWNIGVEATKLSVAFLYCEILIIILFETIYFKKIIDGMNFDIYF